MWSGPGPPSPMLFLCCLVYVPPERHGKREFFCFEFWLRKNVKCTQTHTQGTNFSQDANKIPLESNFGFACGSIVCVCVLFVTKKLNCQHLNVKCIHSYSLAVCRGQFASNCWTDTIESYLDSACQFQGEKYFTNQKLPVLNDRAHKIHILIQIREHHS